MSTRRAEPDAPLSYERYMSSPEYADARAISGRAVAAKCALLASPAQRRLLWFIQGLSVEHGGVARLAQELMEMFPTRVRQEDEPMECSIPERDVFHPVDISDLPVPDFRLDMPLEKFLVELCINPRILITNWPKGESLQQLSEERVRERYRNYRDPFGWDFSSADLSYFEDIIGALVEYWQRHTQRVKAEFFLTETGRQIWQQLDDALENRSMVVIDGLEGRGKTEAVRAWCRMHLGEARYVSLQENGTKTSHFREIARVFGLGHGVSRKSQELQTRTNEVLRESGLMLVLDEAHFLFNQAPRMYSRPEMLDWIDTTLCNQSIPVALVTTPQFLRCMERAVEQVGWNYRQFKRRCKRYVRLPERNTPADIEGVAKHLLPGSDSATIKAVVAYAGLSSRDLSGVGDVAREARLLANREGSKKVLFQHVKRAIHEVLIPSDTPWAEMERRLESKGKGRPTGRGARALEVRRGLVADQADAEPKPSRSDLAGAGAVRQDSGRHVQPSEKVDISRELVPS